MKSLPPLFVPTAILVILYTVGLVGLAGPWTEDLVYLTPYNLLITAGLLLWQARPDARTWAFALLVFVSSYLVETLGVHTGVIFGTYWYGDVLGAKLFDTPLLIGVNWLILVMSVGPLVARLQLPRWQSVLVAALIMVGVDMLIEPVAMHLGFWSWEEDVVPLRNYIAWGVVSAFYFALFFTLPVKRENDFAAIVLGAQLCFFAGIIMVSAARGMERFTYLALDLFTLSFPLIRSFEPRILYWRKWRGLFTGIGVMAVVFLIWDAIFTANGVWGFTPRYLTGPHIARLPLEEVLFFLVVPYSCTFIYEVMRYFVRRDVLGRIARPFCMALIVVLVVVGIWHIGRIYTAITFLCAAGLLFLHVFVLKSPYLGRFLLGYAVVLVPFVLVNGILTGTLLEEPVVWYNNTENLGIRVGTIPLEDSMYLLFFLLLTITFYELPLKRAHGDLPPPVEGHGAD
jgi:lycopene cyclase domain-containing protein